MLSLVAAAEVRITLSTAALRTEGRRSCMKCPYCAREMELGSIQSPYELSWHPGKKRVFAAPISTDETVVLSSMSYLCGSSVNGYLCRKCGKILIDLWEHIEKK